MSLSFDSTPPYRKEEKMRIGVLLLATLLVAAPAMAADVDGKWTGMLATPMGDITLAFEFKADGTMLTGSTQGPDGMAIPIKNGKIDGDKISFVVSLDFGGMAIDLNYSGVVSPAEIKMMGDFAGMPFEFVLKKAA
jgi:hypothetical protein